MPVESTTISIHRNAKTKLNPTIVVIDDDPISQQILSRKLVREGYYVSRSHVIE